MKHQSVSTLYDRNVPLYSPKIGESRGETAVDNSSSFVLDSELSSEFTCYNDESLMTCASSLSAKGRTALNIMIQQTQSDRTFLKGFESIDEELNCRRHTRMRSDGQLPSSTSTTQRSSLNISSITLKRASMQITVRDWAHLPPRLVESLKWERVKEWAYTFRRIDPRYQICRYFNDVAQMGFNAVGDNCNALNTHTLSPLLSMFYRSSIFTV